MIILGLGGLLNDAACSLLIDGRLAAAVEQKKLARRHHPGALPEEAIQCALHLGGVRPSEVQTVALARPFSRRPDSTLLLALRDRFPAARVVMVEHHRAHAASAFYASPFESATVLTLDRAGDFRCGARWNATPNGLTLEHELYYPDSLGDLFGRVTELLGFEPGADEHKVQWMSTAAEPELAGLFEEMFTAPLESWPRLDRTWFDGDRIGRGGFSSRFYQRLGLDEDSPVPEPMKVRIAAGLQRAIERVVLALAGEGENLCLAGGLGMNALLVAALERSGKWKNVFVQPAAGNSGTALGAVWHAWHNIHGRRERQPLDTLCLGPSYSADDIKKVVENCKLRFHYLLTTGELINAAVTQLSGGRIVAWMQNRMEFGPRALGNRSILASPLDPYSTENLNVFIKHREPFRKFAASVPVELASTYFETGPNARFLATVGSVRPEHRKTFEAAVMGDGLVRVHTVSREENPLFHQLLHAWGAKTGLPVLYNTSFNLFGDPLVCTPRDAVRSFYSSGIDALIAGPFVLEK
jgi:carbamoyltransferase